MSLSLSSSELEHAEKLVVYAFSDYNFAGNSNNLRSPDSKDPKSFWMWGDLLRSVLNIKNGVEIKSHCYIDSVGQI